MRLAPLSGRYPLRLAVYCNARCGRAQALTAETQEMLESEKPEPTPVPELPPVDPAALERAVRRAVEVKKPVGGWKKPRPEKEK